MAVMLRAQRRLKRVQPGGDSGLGHIQLFRRAVEVAQAIDGQEGLDGGDVHAALMQFFCIYIYVKSVFLLHFDLA